MEKSLNIIIIFGVVINLIIIWLLSKKKNINLPHKLLIAIFISILFFVLNIFAELNDFDILNILTISVSEATTFIVGPLLFLYIKSLFVEKKGLLKQNWIHFVLPSIYVLFITFILVIAIVIQIFEIKYFPALLNRTLNLLDSYSFGLFLNIPLIIYSILSIKTFNKYAKSAKCVSSSVNLSDIYWIKHLLYGILIIISVDSVLTILDSYLHIEGRGFDAIVISLLVFFLYYLGYKGINQSRILIPDFLIQKIKQEKTSKTILNIDANESEKIILFIKQTINNEKLFLNEDLSLNKLAKATNLNNKKLSAIINQKMKTNFYDLINSYRLDEFKKQILLKENKNITILGVAYDCGFKSKSTFNRLFKLQNSISPSEFKKQNIGK